MLYCRQLAPWLLWLALMLTTTAPTAVTNNGLEQCLVLSNSTADRICSGDMEWTDVSLTHCGRALASVVDVQRVIRLKRERCVRNLTNLIGPDRDAYLQARNYWAILARFDCPQRYSIMFECQDCQRAYLSWICSERIPYWHKTLNRTIKPCRSYCHRVEQMCPFFLPMDKGPAHYAGEPSFQCLDPNIDETGKQRANSTYGSYDCCYDKCGEGEKDICVRGTCGENKRRPIQQGDGTPSTASSGSPDGLNLLTLVLMLTSLIMYRTRLFI